MKKQKDKYFSTFEAAVSLTEFLHKTGQIKDMPTMEEMRAYWDKLEKEGKVDTGADVV